jgi:ribosomal protein L20
MKALKFAYRDRRQKKDLRVAGLLELMRRVFTI